jgi:hypothetical protein
MVYEEYDSMGIKSGCKTAAQQKENSCPTPRAAHFGAFPVEILVF